MRKRSFVITLVSAAVAAGCGEDSENQESAPKAESGPATVLQLRDTSTPGKWSFDKKKLTAKAGRVTIEFTNPGDLGHNVRVQSGEKCCFGPGFKDLGGTQVIGGLAKDSGKTARTTLNLKPGRYWFLCANAGHWQGGQRGALIVN